jgi:outer membrane protein TolC
MQQSKRLGTATIAAAVGLLVFLNGTGPNSAKAQASDTLRLYDALALARSANPTLHAARLRADAAAQRIPQAGAWTNPQLGVGLMNRPLDGFGTDERMTMNVIEVTQRVPWPGKLAFGSERAERMAEADSLDAEEADRQIAARVQAAYYQLAFVDRAVIVMRDTRSLLRNFLEVSSTRYAVGEGLQQDVLQAQISVAQMTEEITVMEQRRIAVSARLNALLGRYPTVPIVAVELPPITDTLPVVTTLMVEAEAARPALGAARARIEAAGAGYRAARRTLYPDFLVRVAYGQRPQYADMMTFTVGVSVPLFAGSRDGPLREEHLAMQAVEEARQRDLYNETFARVTELRAEAERARSLSSLYANAVLPQARAAVESALSSYRVGSVDYMTLVQNQMTVNRYEIESIRLLTDYHRATAELGALVGHELGGAQ